MRKNIRVIVNTGNPATTKTFDVAFGSGDKNQATRVKAVPGARYQLEDLVAQNAGPQRIRSKRVGQDLCVMLDSSAEADLIVEGYYAETLLTDNNRGLLAGPKTASFTNTSLKTPTVRVCPSTWLTVACPWSRCWESAKWPKRLSVPIFLLPHPLGVVSRPMRRRSGLPPWV